MRTRQLFFWLLICVQTLVISGQDSLSRTKPKITIGTKVIWERSGFPILVPEIASVYSGGLQLLKPMNIRFLQIETGVYLNSRAFAEYFDPWYGGTGYHYITFRYLSVPLNCRFNTKYFYVSGGPNADFYINQNTDKWTSNSEMPVRKFVFGVNTNAGLHLTFKNKITVFFEARFSRTIVSPLENYYKDKDSFSRNIGLGFGFNYSFRH